SLRSPTRGEPSRLGSGITTRSAHTRRSAIAPRRSLQQRAKASTELEWGKGPQTPAPPHTPHPRYAAGRTKPGESLIIPGLKTGGRSHGYGGSLGGTSFFDTDIQKALGITVDEKNTKNISDFIKKHCAK